jgi:glucose/arabinose dehydrogenase
MRCLRSVVAAAFVAAIPPLAAAQADLPLDRIRLPPGFAIDVVARVDAARAMTWGDRGTLFVGTRSGRVFAVTLPSPGTTAPARVREVASGLRDPSGVAFRDGAL